MNNFGQFLGLNVLRNMLEEEKKKSDCDNLKVEKFEQDQDLGTQIQIPEIPDSQSGKLMYS